MVFKNIQKIKTALPEVIHIAMFYNNGIIFQTTFEEDINVPKLGENLAELVEHIRKVYDASNLEYTHYRKIIIETEDISIVIIKLGEDSNIALFLESEKSEELKLNSIRRYLKKIENLIDMDEKEIIIKEILRIENEVKSLKTILSKKEKNIENFKKSLGEKDIEKEVSSISEECENIREEINKKEQEIEELKKKF
ncbi:MAG: hypothetical protein BAJALOKI2v1_90002 [Promethearchaeota archaeon]|nr:MAG: hypothetical protein BAJALOKI2v1_90002 [Candidatus Lokiarchaeota archaeon]